MATLKEDGEGEKILSPGLFILQNFGFCITRLERFYSASRMPSLCRSSPITLVNSSHALEAILATRWVSRPSNPLVILLTSA